jgi:hypothetical protein
LFDDFDVVGSEVVLSEEVVGFDGFVGWLVLVTTCLEEE